MILEVAGKRKAINLFLFLIVIAFCFVVLKSVNYADETIEKEEKALSWLPYEQALAKSKIENIPTLLYFYSDNCGWCRKFEEETLVNKEVRELLNKGYALAKINGNSNQTVMVEGKKFTESRISTEVYQVNAFPTIWFLNYDNERIANLPGFVPSDIFLPILIYIRDDFYKKYTFQEFLELKKNNKK